MWLVLDIISEYLHWGMIIASRYEQGSKHENPLMCEMFLRQIYFHLIEAIRDPNRTHVFRQICLDSIHTPLLSLNATIPTGKMATLIF